jgi:hypothetical protein
MKSVKETELEDINWSMINVPHKLTSIHGMMIMTACITSIELIQRKRISNVKQFPEVQDLYLILILNNTFQ